MLSDIKECYLCGDTRALHVHHIFFGTANRKKSEEYKDQCTCYLCCSCHNNIHKNIMWKKLDLLLKKRAQQKWLEEQNKSVNDFVDLFGKNYMEII